jgi:hypothetical protein
MTNTDPLEANATSELKFSNVAVTSKCERHMISLLSTLTSASPTMRRKACIAAFAESKEIRNVAVRV